MGVGGATDGVASGSTADVEGCGVRLADGAEGEAWESGEALGADAGVVVERAGGGWPGGAMAQAARQMAAMARRSERTGRRSAFCHVKTSKTSTAAEVWRRLKLRRPEAWYRPAACLVDRSSFSGVCRRS